MKEAMQSSNADIAARDAARQAARDAAEAARDAARAAKDAATAQVDRLRNLKEIRTGDGGRIIMIPNANGEETRIVIGEDGSVLSTNEHGVAVTAPAAPAAPHRKELPGGLVDMITVIFGFVALTSIGTPLAKAFARRWERKGEREQQVQLTQRLEAIEQAIETVAIEVERISEGQRFTSKLLAERAPSEMERVR
ncbi:MAG: hypothetical protein IBJ03_00925 [Gemmatimonadaceae bacterium]|nr:hypothetical protein [Gemmatimonadaceae bacterium]